ncbi:MAG: T9SS type A sorting domain-containing protein [Bacteroidia bacterium]|nr:T9SS type A sorting domain-containing protein [Bacteroidia bacterium]
MLKVLRIIVLCFPVLWTNLHSQQLSHQVLVPLAGVTTSGKVSYSQTVGETAVEVTGCSFYIFTQGFQQPNIKFSSEIRPVGSGVKVYPNPVNDYLTIEMYGEKGRSFKIEFLDLIGRVIISDKKSFGDDYFYREPYNVKEMVSGFYMIRIMSEDGLFNRTFRIQKI